MKKEKQTAKRISRRLLAIPAAALLAILIGLFAYQIITRPRRIALPQEVQPEAAEETGELFGLDPEGGLTEGAENDRFLLYFDNGTGGICVEDKSDGMKYYSAPVGAMEDQKASETVRMQLASPIRLKYYDITKKTEDEMTSYEDALLSGQITWGKLADGIRIHAVLGREETRHLFPQLISDSSMDQVLSAITSERTIKQVKAFYFYYSLETLETDKQEEMLAKYPALSATGLYVLKNSVTDRDKKVLEDAFTQAGYTYERMEEEYLSLDYEAEDEIFPCFQFSVDCRLTGDGVAVSVNTEDIDYDRERYYLLELALFPAFGAGAAGEEGYVFLPDGSGTLLSFNNDGAKRTLLTRGKVYGPDGAELAGDQGGFKQEFRFPVFGIKTGAHAVFGVISHGDAIARINAEMGNINHSYNMAYADFVLSRKESFLEEGSFELAPWVMYDKYGYSGLIELTYTFLSGEDADYNGMARTYRNYLAGQGMERLTAEETAPFVLETLGAVEMPVRRLGIPVQELVAITSFEDASRMVQELKELGVSGIKLRYQAWYNNGYYHTAASAMKVPGVLGGKKGLRQLAGELAAGGSALFPDVDFLLHDLDTAFDGYQASTDGIRTLFQKNGYYPNLLVSTLEMLDWYSCVNPNLVLGYYERFGGQLQNAGADNISLGSAGRVLNSNYKNSDYVNRQDSERVNTELVRLASEDYGEVMVDGGNAYVLPYADYCLNLADSDSSYLVADESVPFAQIALHGYIRYASEPLNLSSGYDAAALRYIEYGQIPYFLLCGRDSSTLKQAYIFDEVYSVDFENWKEEAAACWSRVDSALQGTWSVPIRRHESLEPGVYATEYENGIRIIVNYNDHSIQTDGIEVGAMDYARLTVKGGE